MSCFSGLACFLPEMCRMWRNWFTVTLCFINKN
jgi:hypothetical protein